MVIVRLATTMRELKPDAQSDTNGVKLPSANNAPMAEATEVKQVEQQALVNSKPAIRRYGGPLLEAKVERPEPNVEVSKGSEQPGPEKPQVRRFGGPLLESNIGTPKVDETAVPEKPTVRRYGGPLLVQNVEDSMVTNEIDYNVSSNGGKQLDEIEDLKSNYMGSQGDSYTDSSVSNEAAHHGMLLHKKTNANEHHLLTWDGNMIEPPSNWSQRPAYNNKNGEFAESFDAWLNQALKISGKVVEINTTHFQEGISHADGVGMDFDVTIPFDVPASLDLNDETNLEFRDETVEKLVKNWVAKYELDRAQEKAAAEKKAKAKRHAVKELPKEEDYVMTRAPPIIPRANIYLRNATNDDTQAMLELYNWYIENTATATELEPLDRGEMIDRVRGSRDEELPVIIAVLRNPDRQHKGRRNHLGLEKLVGFALATDHANKKSAMKDFVEGEVFVHPDHRGMGIGSCLLDKLLNITDISHNTREGYLFHTDPVSPVSHARGGYRKTVAMLITHFHYEEDTAEYLFVKNFMNKFGFVEQGYFRGNAIKNNKWLNCSHLVRKTSWDPVNGF